MTKLFYETTGQGPDIVLLHGWGNHSGIWQFVIEELAKEFRVTTIDLPGFGQSDMISDYSTTTIAKHLENIVPAEAIWVGWSMGGLIATKFALLYPHRVKKLICVASSPKFLKEEAWPGMEAALLGKFSQDLDVNYEATLKRFILLQFYGVTVNKEIIHWFNSNLFLHGKPELAALNAGLKLLESEDLRSELINLNCPLLYLLGKMDTLVPKKIVEALSMLKENIRSVVFEKASHALFISHQNEFLNEVRSFANE